MIARWFAVLGLALVCAACGTTNYQPATHQSQRSAYFAPTLIQKQIALLEVATPAPRLEARGPSAPERVGEIYSCIGGETLRISYSPNGERVTARFGSARAVSLRRGASEGFTSYEGGGAVFRRAGPRAAWALEDGSVRQCRRRLSDA